MCGNRSIPGLLWKLHAIPPHLCAPTPSPGLPPLPLANGLCWVVLHMATEARLLHRHATAVSRRRRMPVGMWRAACQFNLMIPWHVEAGCDLVGYSHCLPAPQIPAHSSHCPSWQVSGPLEQHWGGTLRMCSVVTCPDRLFTLQ